MDKNATEYKDMTGIVKKKNIILKYNSSCETNVCSHNFISNVP